MSRKGTFCFINKSKGISKELICFLYAPQLHIRTVERYLTSRLALSCSCNTFSCSPACLYQRICGTGLPITAHVSETKSPCGAQILCRQSMKCGALGFSPKSVISIIRHKRRQKSYEKCQINVLLVLSPTFHSQVRVTDSSAVFVLCNAIVHAALMVFSPRVRRFTNFSTLRELPTCV